MKKRILSIVLAICLVLSCVPITVFAANADATDLQNLLNGGGTVTLSKDYTIDTTLNVKNTVTLDLNGHVIKMTGSNSVISVAWGNLTLQDSNKTATHTDTSLPAGGVITGGNVYGGVYVGSGDFTMNGGTIQGCSAEYGGGVAVMAGSFTMTGGTIANCKATTSNYAVGGGGVYVAQNSNFTMNGGTIENCSAASTFGGGVCSYGNSSMSGNAIIRGCSAKAGGGVRIDNSSMTINGGTIEGCASTSGTSDAVMIVDAHLLANGGTVKGMVTFGSNSAITTTSTDSYTKFYNEVTNSSTISGGVYYGGIQNKSSGTVSGTYHTVSFDSNGGSGSVPTQWFVNTDKAPALQPADPTKDGYQAFDGWYNGDTRYDFSQPVTQDITLTAKFSNPITYDISYNLAGGTATNPATYNVESDAITLNNPTKTGYTFTGWRGTGLTGENNMTVTIAKGSTGDRAYTAHFSQNNYTVKFDTNGGSSISDKTGVKWTDTVLDGITAPTKDGWEFTGWKCGDMTVNANTKYSDLVANDTVKSVTLVAQWKDITAPTGEISVGTNKWNGFLNTITFGLFFKDTQSVTITASDNSGEDVTIEYLLSDKELTVDQLNSATFNAYNDKFSINPDNKYVIYAKLTDKSGNVAYLSSDGIVLDKTAPIISGIENGKVYCEAQTVTVTEEYIASVKVNGTEVTLDANNQFTLNPAEGTQTIVVTDKAGNVSAEMIVTVNDGHTYEWQSENGQYWQKCKYCGYETAKKDIPTFTIDAPDTVCRTQDCEASVTLSDNISDAALSFEFIGLGGAIDTTVEDGKLYGVVTANGYPDAENSFNFVVYATTDDGFPFTVSKTVQIQNEHAGGVATCTELAICDTCGKPYGALDSTNHNLEKISATDATVTQTGNKEYWHCLDCGKYFADENGTTEITLDDTVIAKLPPEIIEGKGQNVTAGDRKELTFKSNAAFGDFIRVELDGKTLDEKYYTVKEGSTIVTLKADYVATLSAGEHTIGIVSESGTATTTFTVNAKAVEDKKEMKSPETGNDGATALWIAFILSCGGAIVVTSSYGKRKKHN
nr:InlB B-repeat-containing protein [Eubacteriales bacterium]